MPAITGKVRNVNISPKGLQESFLLDDGKRIVQINLPRHSQRTLKAGQSISINAKPYKDERPSDHPVFSWIDEEEKTTYDGVVKQINYALYGEPNGAILKSGEFVHMRPGGARAVKLRIGQQLAIEGDACTASSGQVVIEARIVNGLALKGHSKKAGKKHAAA